MIQMDERYLPRIIDETLKEYLGVIGGVLLEGPRACGKTATGSHHAASMLRLDTDNTARELAAIDPALVLEGDAPRLIDEWQTVPEVWNHVRHAIDDRGRPGQFLLTGSAVPSDDVTRHTGAGRIVRVKMRPMSLYESGESRGDISLSALMDGDDESRGRSDIGLRELTEAIVRGGWPTLLGAKPRLAQEVLRSYLDDIARLDVQRVDEGRRRDAARVKQLIVALGRNVATDVSIAALAADTSAGEDPIRPGTAREYLDALERVMVIEDQPSWGPHLRSRYTVRKAPKRHFIDPSLAAAAVNATPERLLTEPSYLGLLFESMVVRDLRIYSQRMGGVVRHYRDSSGREVDAVVTRDDGAWAAVEVKLGERQADSAAASLLSFASHVDTAAVGHPTALVVITAGTYAYTRPDGVRVVPLGMLGP